MVRVDWLLLVEAAIDEKVKVHLDVSVPSRVQ